MKCAVFYFYAWFATQLACCKISIMLSGMSDVFAFHVSSQLMAAIRLGPHGPRVAIYAEEKLRAGIVYATIPRQHTEDETAGDLDWDTLQNQGAVTQTAAQVNKLSPEIIIIIIIIIVIIILIITKK